MELTWWKRLNPAWALAAVFLVVQLAYANHFGNSFHFDDSHTISDNPWIRDLRNIPRFFVDGSTFSTLPPNRTYRPFVSTSLAIDYRLGRGLQPLWFHVSTFFWYLVQLGAMFVLFRHTLNRARPGPLNLPVALFAVTLYGVHPAMAETINYIIQRGDLYSTLGVVAGLAIYIAAPRQRKYGLYLLPPVLAILSKPPAVVFPLLLFVWILLFDSSLAKDAARRSLPAVAVCAAALFFVSRMNPPAFTGGAASPYSYRITQPWVLLGYFRKFLIPSGLTADTDQAQFSSLADPCALLGFLFLALCAGAAWWCARRADLRPVSFGLWWFLIASLPTSIFPLAEVENDHRMFFPFVGLSLAVCWAGALLAERAHLPAKILAPALALLIAILVWGTWQRNRVWNNEESLWRDVSVKSPKNGRGLMNYGLTLMGKGDYVAARDLFQRAAVFTPNYYILEINLGVDYGALGDAAAAEQHFTRAISLSPSDAGPYFFYARWLSQVHRIPEAIVNLKTAVGLNPDYLNAQYLLLQLLADSGNASALRAAAQAVLDRFPADATASSWLARAAALPPPDQSVARPAATADLYVNQSLSFFKTGKYPECIEAAKKALALAPDNATAWNNLGACHNSLLQWDEGIAAETQALRVQPDFQLARNNLAWARERKQKTGK
jgi:tetratricopeptide (TPR) repeat protein